MDPNDLRRLVNQRPEEIAAAQQQPQVPELSMVLPGELPAQWMLGPHPMGEKRVLFRLARPGAALTVELSPQDALKLSDEIKRCANAVKAGIFIPPNGQGPGPIA